MRYIIWIIIAVFIGVSAFAVVDVAANKIKGNSETMIFHVPGCSNYRSVVMGANDRWFSSEEAAIKAGFRKAKNCP